MTPVYILNFFFLFFLLFVVSPFATVPSNKSACLSDFATFGCSSEASTSRLFFFVNHTPVVALPRRYEAVSFGKDERTLEFRILALEATNGSMIVCGIDVSGRISNFSKPAFLTGIIVYFQQEISD